MKKIIFVFLGILGLFLISCKAVPLEVPVADSEKLPDYDEGNPQMEFIGWKASSDTLLTSSVATQVSGNNLVQKVNITTSEFDSWKAFKNDPVLSNFGDKLQKHGIAENKAYAYFGIYSLQELELYKSKHRYVTFIQVNKNRLSGQSTDNRNVWVATGLTSLGCGLVFNCLSTTINPDDY